LADLFVQWSEEDFCISNDRLERKHKIDQELWQ
jgi:hypothetical protein